MPTDLEGIEGLGDSTTDPTSSSTGISSGVGGTITTAAAATAAQLVGGCMSAI